MKLARIIKRSTPTRWPVVTPQLMGRAVRQRVHSRLVLALCALGWVVAAACSSSGYRQEVIQPQDTPTDHTIAVETDSVMARMLALMEPYIAQARATYPDARRRYLARLPSGYTFAVVTRLHDDRGRMEQVFVVVDQIRDGQITGRIWSDVAAVSGFYRGQEHTFPETELIDWVIVDPDGTEEGNYVGKFMDEYLRIKH